MPKKRLTAGLLTAAATAGLIAATPSPASAAVNYNFCGGRYSTQINNSTAFTTETYNKEIVSRTLFRRADGSVIAQSAWYSHGFRGNGVWLDYKVTWAGSHPDAVYSTSIWRALNGDGSVARTWYSGNDYC